MPESETQAVTPYSPEVKYPTVVGVMREWLKSPAADQEIFDSIAQLRQEVESPEKWRETKELAKQELESVPDNILGSLLQASSSFIDSMPAAHSKGHLARDLVHLTELLHTLTPEQMQSYDNVELLVAILAGTFHDIGNSVVERYAERERLSGHAEVGAYLFAWIAKEIKPPLPENILKLTQLAIAAHTNYETPIPVPKHNPVKQRLPYDTVIHDGDKLSLRDTKITDRLEIQSVVHPVRHILGVAEPVETFSGGKFHEANKDPQADFARQFTRNPDMPGTILYHFQDLINSVGENTWHTRQDTQEMVDELFRPKSNGLQQFIDAVMQDSPEGIQSEEDRENAFANYLKLCRLLEPGIDIDRKIELLQEKFHKLPPSEQDHWAAGFKVLVETLYPKLYEQMRVNVASIPDIIVQRGGKIASIFEDLHTRARNVLLDENPDLLNGAQAFPDVLDALIY